MISKKSLDFDAIRARMSQSSGKEYWRSLEELAESEVFEEFLYREFPRHATPLPTAVTRRNFVKLMGASLALAGLTGCGWRQPEKIVPYVAAPEGIIYGKPLFFATAMQVGGIATGLLVESHMGRPIKVEGNPDHPGSLGATDSFAQSAVLTLYDPDRSQAVTSQGRIRTMTDFLTAFRAQVEQLAASGGAGLRILTEGVGSPTMGAQLDAILSDMPQARWYQYEPVGRDNQRAGAELAFGEDTHTVYRFDRANVVLSLDNDFLSLYPGTVRYVNDFADRRRVREGQREMNRLYVAEATYTTTGAKADHRLPLRAGEIEGLARRLASQLGVEGIAAPELDAEVQAWVAALASDLQANQGASLVIVGDGQPPAVHALAHAINEALGNVGETLYYTDPVQFQPPSTVGDLSELAAELAAGSVDVLMILGGNPAYTAPADLNFAQALQNVPFSVHLGLYENETAQLCTWHVPEAHFLESWSDARAFDGTASIIQPLIEPLYNGVSVHELLATLTDTPQASSYDLVRGFWEGQSPSGNFERFWRAALHSGTVPNTELEPKSVTLRDNWSDLPDWLPPEGLEIVFRPDPTIYDGRFANNGWLQELPKQITKLTWDNAVLVSVNTAQELGLSTGDVVELHYRDRMVRGPIFVLPGHVDRSVTVALGYGQENAGRVGNGLGFNAYAIRPSDTPWIGGGLDIVKTGEEYRLATTQQHHMLQGNDEELVRSATLDYFLEHPTFAQKIGHGEDEVAEPPSLYPEYAYEGYKWGMTVDMTACVGCGVCVIACQAENNIPIVGKDEVLRNREMHWLRVDTYFAGDLDNPEAFFQPLPCMHCEKAPCEPVCPVAATVHSEEGLNQMVYNRCVGTRYCSNNCPYKVRRFNFLEYTEDIPVLNLHRNPDVTVRSRGVMEKCTYCVQRITQARIEADKENRPIRDGEILTACQAVCPTKAIVFGDMNDPGALVTRLKEDPLNYSLLAELGTQPRTSYLAAVRNLNSELTVAEG